VQQNRSDFGNRLIASVNVSTLAGNTSTDDQRGHGTFVAGIAAGAASDLAGASPVAPIVSVKVMDQNGQAKTSDVITACQWILDNKAKYNIRVANFSLHSSYGTNFYRDPLDQAVEKLWFNNVVVVAAAGNYGTANGPSGVKYSPGNDPFVITVGAVDLGNSLRANDDTVAPWSAWGYTYDGFYKPDISAPGRYMVGPIAPGSTLTSAKAGNMVGTDRIQLSGTSFAAPVVSGTVADMLARHPNWTPDQVKGALMRTARALHIANPRSAGLGEITASRAVMTTVTPNPNAGLERFVSVLNGTPSFDAAGWSAAATASMSWNSMSWADQSWSDMSWADQAWAAMSWADMSWSDMSWADMSWADMSWADVTNEDAAEGDDLSGSAGYVASPTVATDASTDPDTAVPVDGLDPAAALGVAPDPATDATLAPVVDTTTATPVADPTATTDTTTVTAPPALVP
jgi:serine protease AprX